MNDQYAHAISDGISTSKDLKTINLKNSGLTDKGFCMILEKAPNQMNKIDISGNTKIDSLGYAQLGYLLEDIYK
jgi:hypothetical protein